MSKNYLNLVPNNLLELRDSTESYLSQFEHILQPRQEAIWLIQYFFKKPYSDFDWAFGLVDTDWPKLIMFRKAITMRTELEKPLAYILRTIDFCELTLKIEEPVLIPRVETEFWVVALVKYLKNNNLSPQNILDLCTGSGCIALALAHEFAQSLVIGSDIEDVCVQLALRNKKKLNLTNVEFVKSDLFESFTGQQFELIVSNPPYIPDCDYQLLPKSVKNWESQVALSSGSSGLEVYQRLIADAKKFLSPNGILAMEISPEQVSDITELLKNHGFASIQVWQDLFGRDRVVIATRL